MDKLPIDILYKIADIGNIPFIIMREITKNIKLQTYKVDIIKVCPIHLSVMYQILQQPEYVDYYYLREEVYNTLYLTRYPLEIVYDQLIKHICNEYNIFKKLIKHKYILFDLLNMAIDKDDLYIVIHLIDSALISLNDFNIIALNKDIIPDRVKLWCIEHSSTICQEYYAAWLIRDGKREEFVLINDCCKLDPLIFIAIAKTKDTISLNHILSLYRCACIHKAAIDANIFNKITNIKNYTRADLLIPPDSDLITNYCEECLSYFTN